MHYVIKIVYNARLVDLFIKLLTVLLRYGNDTTELRIILDRSKYINEKELYGMNRTNTLSKNISLKSLG